MLQRPAGKVAVPVRDHVIDPRIFPHAGGQPLPLLPVEGPGGDDKARVRPHRADFTRHLLRRPQETVAAPRRTRLAGAAAFVIGPEAPEMDRQIPDPLQIVPEIAHHIFVSLRLGDADVPAVVAPSGIGVRPGVQLLRRIAEGLVHIHVRRNLQADRGEGAHQRRHLIHLRLELRILPVVVEVDHRQDQQMHGIRAPQYEVLKAAPLHRLRRDLPEIVEMPGAIDLAQLPFGLFRELQRGTAEPARPPPL